MPNSLPFSVRGYRLKEASSSQCLWKQNTPKPLSITIFSKDLPAVPKESVEAKAKHVSVNMSGMLPPVRQGTSHSTLGERLDKLLGVRKNGRIWSSLLSCGRSGCQVRWGGTVLVKLGSSQLGSPYSPRGSSISLAPCSCGWSMRNDRSPNISKA